MSNSGDFPPPTPAAQPLPPTGATTPPGGQRNTRTLWIIGGVVALIIAAVVGVVALGGDDDKAAAPDDTETVDTETSNTETVDDTSPVTAATPETIPPAQTAAPTTAPSGQLVDVTDDSNSFVVAIPGAFETLTSGVTLGGVDYAHVSGSDEMAAYLQGDLSVLGISVLAAPTAQVGTPDDLLSLFDLTGSCDESTTEIGRPTPKGAATVQRFDGCGSTGSSAVYVALELPDRPVILFVGVQGPGPSSGDLFDTTMAVLDSVRPA